MSTHLSTHNEHLFRGDTCIHSPAFVTECTRALGFHRQRFGRELIDSYAIKGSEVNVSSPSLILSEREFAFLRPELSKLG